MFKAPLNGSAAIRAITITESALAELYDVRTRLLRVATQFDNAGETEAAHAVRWALLFLEDAKDSL